jgi:predicted secreted protein
MPGIIGRKITLTWAPSGTAIAIPGVQEKGVTFGGEPIDTSADDNSGWRELLDEAGQKEIDISISGVTKSPALRNAWNSNDRTGPATVTWPDGSIVTGSFVLADYKETGPYKEAATFEATLKSTGTITYTPGT